MTRSELLSGRGYPAEMVNGNGTRPGVVATEPDRTASPAAVGLGPSVQEPEETEGRSCGACGGPLRPTQRVACSQRCSAVLNGRRAREMGTARRSRRTTERDRLARLVHLLVDAGCSLHCEVDGLSLTARRDHAP